MCSVHVTPPQQHMLTTNWETGWGGGVEWGGVSILCCFHNTSQIKSQSLISKRIKSERGILKV